MITLTATRVVHCQKAPYDIYIGRDMPRYKLKDQGWGNPYKGDNAVSNYRAYLMTQRQLLEKIPGLQGKTLGCWCKSADPYANPFIDCHGDVLAELADASPIARRVEWLIATATRQHQLTSYGQIMERLKYDRSVDGIIDKLAERLIITTTYDKDSHLCFRHNPMDWLLEHTVRAISLNPPWSTLIALGQKKNETRGWKPDPSYLKPGDILAIHATKNFPAECKSACYDPIFVHALWPDIDMDRPLTHIVDERIKQLPTGVIVATATVREFRSTNDRQFIESLTEQERAFGNYDANRWAWVLENITPLTPPIPATGHQGLWNWQMEMRES